MQTLVGGLVAGLGSVTEEAIVRTAVSRIHTLVARLVAGEDTVTEEAIVGTGGS